MTTLLEKAIAIASEKSPEEQDALGALWIAEMEDEAGWQKRFEEHPEVLDSLIAQAEEEIRRGEVRPLVFDEE